MAMTTNRNSNQVTEVLQPSFYEVSQAKAPHRKDDARKKLAAAQAQCQANAQNCKANSKGAAKLVRAVDRAWERLKCKKGNARFQASLGDELRELETQLPRREEVLQFCLDALMAMAETERHGTAHRNTQGFRCYSTQDYVNTIAAEQHDTDPVDWRYHDPLVLCLLGAEGSGEDGVETWEQESRQLGMLKEVQKKELQTAAWKKQRGRNPNGTKQQKRASLVACY